MRGTAKGPWGGPSRIAVVWAPACPTWGTGITHQRPFLGLAIGAKTHEPRGLGP